MDDRNEVAHSLVDLYDAAVDLFLVPEGEDKAAHFQRTLTALRDKTIAVTRCALAIDQSSKANATSDAPTNV
jgi:hypothetical protein